jgi:hypothetical protein
MDNEKIELTKRMATGELATWKGNRASTIAILKEKEPAVVETVEKLFAIADQLSDTIIECMKINHHLAPQIVAIVSSMVLGITKGTGIKEVETLLRVRDAVLGLQTEKGLH